MAANPAMVVRVAATIEELKKNLAEGKSQIETTTAAMAKLSASFSGEKLIQAAHNVTAAVNAIGGASRLTEAEQARVNATVEKALEKYRALGREAPAAMRLLADETHEAAEALRNTSSAGEGFSAWLGQANSLLGIFGIGLSVGALVSFATSIMDGADSLIKLHDQTNISIEGLQQLRAAGDDAGVGIETMASGINRLQTRLGAGDTGVNLALRDLHINLKEFKSLDAAQQFIAISDAMRDLQDPLEFARVGSQLFGKSWAELAPVIKRGFDDVKDGAVGMSAATATALDDAGDSAHRFWQAVKDNFGEAMADILTGTTADFRRTTSDITNQINAMTKAASAAAPKMEELAVPGLPEDLTEIERVLTANATAMADLAVQIEKDEKALAPFRAAMDEVNSAGLGWKGTLDTIDGTIVESIKFYLEAGVSQGALATAYGLTATQLRAVASDMRAETDATKAAAAAADALTKAHAADIAEMEKSIETRKRHNEELRKQKEAADAAKKAMRELGGSMEYDLSTPEGMLAFQKANPGASISVGPEYFKTHSLQDALAAGLIDLYAAFKGLMGMAKLPGLATGAQNYPGGWATVGERGPEQMYVPPGSNVYPTGTSPAGVSVGVHVTVNGPMIGTQQQLAAVIDAALMKRLRDTGVRF